MSAITVFGTGTSSGATKVWVRGWGAGILANLDLTNTVYFSPEPAPINTQSDSIPPLGAIGVDGTRDLYASTLTAAKVIVQATPGASWWVPGPAQVAASIAALGLATETTQLTVASHTSGVAKDNTLATVALNTTGAALDSSITTTLPDTLQTGGIPPFLPNPVGYASAGLTPGNNTTLVSWTTGSQRVWSTYLTLSASTNASFTGTALFQAWIGDGSGNLYATATLRFGGPNQSQAVCTPFDARGIQLAGPNSLYMSISAPVANAVAAADGGVLISD